jgi:hypothetical protein
VRLDAIRVEAGTRHALAYCRECGTWREIRADRRTALTAAADHALRCHRDQRVADHLRARARATPN